MAMYVVAFNGSPRKHGNTYSALNVVLEQMANEGVEGDIIQIGGKNLAGCKACYKCFQTKDRTCIQKSDEMNYFIERAYLADALLIGSPVYFSNVSTEVKAFIDRCGMVARANENMLQGKVGAAVVAARRAGGTFTYSAINFFFGISQMIIPSSDYWNLGIGRMPGELLQDQEGVETLKILGHNMARLLNKIRR